MIKPIIDRYQTLVSVVMPAYNIDHYILSAIRSVQHQTYRNIEIILIDDGSIDQTGQIMEEAAKEDDRIRVFHHEVCKGISNGRNEGVSLAQGSYLTFIDGDDVIAVDYISSMIEIAESMSGDMVCCDYFSFQEEAPVFPSASGSSPEIYTGAEAVRAVYKTRQHGMTWTVWAKLYRTDLFRYSNVQFPEGCIHEDMAVTYRLMDTAKTVVYFNQVLYGYRRRQGSIMSSQFSRNNLPLLSYSRQAIDYFLERGEPDLSDLACNYHIRISFTFLQRIRKEKTFTDKDQHDLLNGVREDIRRYVDPGHLPLWKKVVFHITARFPFQILLKKAGTEF